MAVNLTSGASEKRREIDQYSPEKMNQAFNDFLRLKVSDQKFLNRYNNTLMKKSEDFARVFYRYLMDFPATASVLENFCLKGGQIDDLVKKQLQHLFGLLSGRIDHSTSCKLANIGKVHHHHGIEPVWIMGAYKLYLDHLQTIIRNDDGIKEQDRNPLENIVTKLLFRDMGLMLEGYWDASVTSISESKEKVVNLQGQITSLLTNLPQVLWSIDITNNKVLYVSPSAREVCEMDVELPIPCLNWTISEDRHKVKQAWQKALKGRATTIESRVIQPDGEQLWFRRKFYPCMNDNGEVVRIDGLMEDTTADKAILDRLNTLATTDSLTGLPNRALFYDRLDQAVSAANRNKNQQIVLMLIDMDRFKEINDTLGHPAGDIALKTLSQRIQNTLRETDTLARLGGDEFAVLLSQVKDSRPTAQRIAKKIQQALANPCKIQENEVFLAVSIGIAIYPEHGYDIDTLVSRADVALYSAKTNQCNYEFYQPDFIDPKSEQIFSLSRDLRYALERGELVLNYQPKIDLQTNSILGAEALIRWHHPDRGLISPDDFIHIAERTGLINDITRWVIEEAMTQCQLWRQSGFELSIAVNISSRSFQNADFVDWISSVLEKLNMPANFLEIEITENILISNIANTSRMLEQISNLGVTIAIDDFGTGYSSLAYLKALPLHVLKIDKSFVKEMINDENDKVIVRSTIDLAHNLGFTVIAEGIERYEMLDMLKKMGCDCAQGNHFSKPLSAEKFLTWVKQDNDADIRLNVSD